MVDEVTDIDQIAAAPEAAERQWTKEEVDAAYGGLIKTIGEIIPGDEDFPDNLGYTPLRKVLRDRRTVSGWFFEQLVNNRVRRFAQESNETYPNLVQESPVNDGEYNGVRFAHNDAGSFFAYMDEHMNGSTPVAEYDGIVRVGERLIILEMKLRDKPPKASELNLEGKYKALRKAFPDSPISFILVTKPKVQRKWSSHEIDSRRGNYTIINLPGARLNEVFGAITGRIHVMASGTMQPALA